MQSKKWEKKSLIIEAANPIPDDINKTLKTKYAILDGNDLFIENDENGIYNTLIDRFETNNLIDKNKLLADKNITLLEKIRGNQSTKWVSNQLPSRYIINLSFNINKNEQNDIIKSLIDPYNPLIVYSIEHYVKNWSQHESLIQKKLIPAMAAPYSHCKIEDNIKIDNVKNCKNSLYKAYFNFTNPADFNLDPKKAEFDYQQAKEELFNKIKRDSQNLALENIWGLEKMPPQNYIEEIFFKDRTSFSK